MKKKKINKPLVYRETFKKFVDEFKDESDRAAVVLGAAKLDSLLRQILDQFLLPPATSDDELLDGDSPLSTFSSRINMCYRLGLITPEFSKQIHLVRRTRNAFAHEVAKVSLDSGSHADRIKTLLLPFIKLPFFHDFREIFFGKEDSVSVNFRTCLALMAARLENRLENTQTISDQEAWNCILGHWVKSLDEIEAEKKEQAE